MGEQYLATPDSGFRSSTQFQRGRHSNEPVQRFHSFHLQVFLHASAFEPLASSQSSPGSTRPLPHSGKHVPLTHSPCADPGAVQVVPFARERVRQAFKLQ
jgi:hypothetical protein